MKSIFLVVGMFVSIHAYAADKSVSKQLTDTLAAQFFVGESGSARVASVRCEDQHEGQGPSCNDVACDLVGDFNCDSLSEVERIGNACRGNHNGLCLRSMCRRLGSYNCDSVQEVEQVAGFCRGSLNEKCVDLSCKLVGEYNCDSFSEVERIGRACNGVRSSCIESVCRRLGAYNCDSISEVEQVAASCRGN